MLHLPESTKAPPGRRKNQQGEAPSSGYTPERLSKLEASERRLSDLELPIIDARHMASILSVLAERLSRDIIFFRSVPNTVTAVKMESDISDDVEQLLFAVYHLDDMVREIHSKYVADLTSGER